MITYPYNILLIYPAAAIDGVNAFIKQNIDPSGASWVSLALSTDGNLPLAYGWTSFVATTDMANTFLALLAQSLGSTPPAGFTDLPRDQQSDYITQTGQALWAAEQIYFASAWNDEGQQVDWQAALDYCGLKRYSPPLLTQG